MKKEISQKLNNSFMREIPNFIRTQYHMLYWMQTVLKIDNWNRLTIVFEDNIKHIDAKETQLHLKSVKNITNNHLIQLTDIAKNQPLNSFLDSELYPDLTNYTEEEKKIVFGKYLVNSRGHWSLVQDFLRLKGYATDYLGYRLHEFIEAGWVKIIE